MRPSSSPGTAQVPHWLAQARSGSSEALGQARHSRRRSFTEQLPRDAEDLFDNVQEPIDARIADAVLARR